MEEKAKENFESEFLPIETIERHIYAIRGRKMMLDRDLAELYEAPTFRLNEAVKRNCVGSRKISCSGLIRERLIL